MKNSTEGATCERSGMPDSTFLRNSCQSYLHTNHVDNHVFNIQFSYSQTKKMYDVVESIDRPLPWDGKKMEIKNVDIVKSICMFCIPDYK